MIQIVLIVLAVAVGLALETDHENQCGGLLREESGVIAPRISEGEEVFVCLWIIKNLPGKRIKLQVRDLYTVSDAYCSQDRIEIEDDDRVLGTFCREAEIPPMFTQNDHMYILSFHGNGPTLFFNASYSHIDVPKKQCGGVLQDEVGWLSSPDHDKDSLYDSSLDCTWIINAKSDRRIVLHFLFFDVVGENNCQDGDYVKILKRGKETLGMFCDSKLPPIMVSDSTRLVLQFHTDYRNHAEGFNVTFTQVFVDSLNCGGLLNEDNGRLMISDIQNSSGNQECLWIISAREDKVVELTVTKLQIEQLTDCSEEHLRVYDDVRLSKKYCNSVVSTRVRSTTNMMFVVLQSKDPGRVTFRASFSQQYEFSDICGGIVNQSTGMITSPDENILTSLDSTIVDCFWVIEGEADTEIEFDIKNLQVYRTYPCKDYLQVYDGHSAKEKKCDSAIAKTPIRSVSNVLYVRFHTGTGGSFGKFRGRFSQKGALNKTCGGVLQDTVGMIINPDVDHDGLTDHNLNCLWTIIAEEHKVIYLNFIQVMLEESVNCKYDFLWIYEGENNTEEGMIHCGGLSGAIRNYLSATNKVHVHFITDESISAAGFKLKYEQILDPMAICESEVNATFGWITQFEHNYLTSEYTECSFVLRAEVGKLVHIDPFELNLMTSVFCQYSFVEIEEKQKLCGHLFLPSFRSRTNTLQLHFSTRASDPGFNITYYQVDGYETSYEMVQTDKTGWLAYPFGDKSQKAYQNYDASFGPYNLAFLWTIICHETEVIMVTVMTAKIVPYDFLQGESFDSLVIYECHRAFRYEALPSSYEGTGQTFISEYNEVHVDFKTGGWGNDWKDSEIRTNFIIKYEVFRDTQPTCVESYKCIHGNTTLSRNRICDGKRDCLGYDDERYCYTCPENCSCYRLYIDCAGETQCEYPRDTGRYIWAASDSQNGMPLVLYDGIKVLNISTNPQVYRDLQLERQNLNYLLVLNISYCEIQEFPAGFFRTMKNLETLDISYNAIQRLKSHMFRSQGKLKHLRFEGNFGLLTFEPMSFASLSSLRNLKLSHLRIKHIAEKAFFHLTLSTLEILDSAILYTENGVFQDLQVETLLLNTSVIHSYPDLLFEGVQNLSLLVTDSYMMCCLKPFYLPEKNCLPPKPGVQSCHDLLGNERYLLWVSCLVALMGNIASLKHRIPFHKKDTGTYHRLFVFNLGLSNFLIVSYIVIIITTDSSLRGIYFFGGKTWLSGKWCKAARVISSVSLLSGVVSVGLIAVGRYLMIKYPTGKVTFTRRAAVTASLISWLIVALVSTGPVLYHILSNITVFSDYGLCFGLSFNRGRPSARLIAMVTPLIINVFTAGLVFVSFVHMYKEYREKKDKRVRERLMRTEDLRVSRNILILVALNVLYTTAVYSFAAFGTNDDAFGHEMVTWVTVIISSLVSALNPFCYSLTAFFDVHLFEPNINEQNRPTLYSKSEFEQLLSLAQSRCYLKPYTRKQGYISLTKLIKIRNLCHKEVAFIAYCLAKRLNGLHEKGLVLQSLRGNDVHVRRDFQRRGFGVVLICRHPLIMTKPSDTAMNIGDYGYILSAVIDTFNDNKDVKKEVDGSNDIHKAVETYGDMTLTAEPDDKYGKGNGLTKRVVCAKDLNN